MDVNLKDAIKQTNIPKLKELSFTAKDLFLAIAMLVIGFLYWELIQIWTMGLGVTVFFFTLTILSTAYLRMSGFRQNRVSIICNALIYISAANFFIFDSIMPKIFIMLWLMFLYVYWIALFTERTLGEKISVYSIGDWLRQVFVTPFANFASLFVILIFRKKGNGRDKKIISGAIGLLIFLPLLILVVSLLSSADPTFEKIFSGIFDIELYKIPTYVRELVLGLPVAMYLCGSVIGNTNNRYASCSKEHMDKRAEELGFAPNTAINTALAAFCVIYAVFIAVQVINLFKGLAGDLPGDMTYAQYARKGFFQLCFVAGINLGICAVTYTFVKDRTAVMFKGLTAFMALATMILGATAISKMVIYIKYFGLTQLRVYVSWFIILLILIFAVVLMRQFKSFNGTRAIAVIFTVCFMMLVFGNIDGQIAKYNLARYEAGTLKAVDVDNLASLSSAAAPYIYEAYKNIDDKKVKEALYYAAADKCGGAGDGEASWKGFNLQKNKGRALREKMGADFNLSQY